MRDGPARSAQPAWAVVPAFHEGRHIAPVVAQLRAQGVRVVVVDDGSTDDTAAAAEKAGADVVRHTVNRGKGAALQTGFAFASARDAAVVVVLDGDGQHAPDDIPVFLAAYEAGDFDVLVGNRMDATAEMPFIRRMTNRFMSWLLSREMGQRVPDTQCGYRLYSRQVLPLVKAEATGFAAESEQLLELAAEGVRMGSVPIQTIYGDERSKIRPVRDTLRFFAMLRRFRRDRRARGGARSIPD